MSKAKESIGHIGCSVRWLDHQLVLHRANSEETDLDAGYDSQFCNSSLVIGMLNSVSRFGKDGQASRRD